MGSTCAPQHAVVSAQFTAKQLEKLAKKAEKDSKAEQTKVKKVCKFSALGPFFLHCLCISFHFISEIECCSPGGLRIHCVAQANLMPLAGLQVRVSNSPLPPPSVFPSVLLKSSLFRLVIQSSVLSED